MYATINAVVDWVVNFYRNEPFAWSATSIFVLTSCGFLCRAPRLLERKLRVGVALYELARVGSRLVLAAMGVSLSTAVAMAQDSSIALFMFFCVLLLLYLFVLMLEYYSDDLRQPDFFSRCAVGGLYLPLVLGGLSMLIAGFLVRGVYQ
jgi:hypothetical protein